MKMILRQNFCCRRCLPDHHHRFLVGILLLFSAVEVQKMNASTAGGFRRKGIVERVDIGVILDLDSSAMVGKMSKTSISMAFSDFYQLHNHTSVRIVPHIRNSNSDNVEAAFAAIDLLKNVQVKAIIGPQRSTQTGFVINIGDKAEVPIISLATSPSLSPKENSYLIRTAQCSSFQAKPIAAIVEAFGWREVVFVYEESEFGRGLIPNLTDAMIEVNAQVKYRSILSPSASDDRVMQELYKLMTMQTRVFVVHLLPSLASRFFVKANEAGMMNKGYAWIVTDVVTTLLHSLSPRYIDSMQGVLGVKPYIPKSKELENFSMRWKRNFRKENPDIDRIELDMFGIWAYDSTFALATALERVGLPIIQRNNKFSSRSGENSSTDLAAIGTSDLGSKLLPLIRNIRFKGVSGDFHVANGQLKSSAYELVNVIGTREKKIGFWSSERGLSKTMNSSDKIDGYTTNKNDLGAITWPGDTNVIPRGWEIPTNDHKLRVGVPARGGFEEFIKVERDNQTNEIKVTGFCVDVFKAVIDALPYVVLYEFVPFEKFDGDSAGSYDDHVYRNYLQNFDAVVGDVTITGSRSKLMDFALPYTESGVSMIVPIKKDQKKNAWIFMEPLEMSLWVTTAVFFVSTGCVVWLLEHRVNKEFRGRPHEQVGMIFYFSFSTLVFAHKEKMTSNLARFVVIVWVFVVLVLTSSYTASLTSMLTVQKLQPAFSDIHDLVRRGEKIGYQYGSFTIGMLKQMTFHDSNIKTYTSFDQYDDALSKGEVAAIFDELPYLRRFLSIHKYCTKYTMAGPTFPTAGLGFAFTKGSPLVRDVSTAILDVTEKKMTKLLSEWFGKEADCPEQHGSTVNSDKLKLDSFKGLFLIAAISSSFALIIFLFIFIYENRQILVSEASIWDKFIAIAKTFDEIKDQGSDESRKTSELNESEAANEDENSNMIVTDGPPSPAISVFQQDKGLFPQEEGISTTEPGTPIHYTINIPETTTPKRLVIERFKPYCNVSCLRSMSITATSDFH